MTDLASEPVRPTPEKVAPVVSPADRAPVVSRSTALRVGAADDRLEREADDVADTIVSALRSNPGPGSTTDVDSSGRVQRTSGSPRPAGEGDDTAKAQRVQRAAGRAANGAPNADGSERIQRSPLAVSAEIRRAGTDRVIRREIGKVPAPYKPVEKLGKEPTTLAELAANAERSAATWMKNHDVLLNILLGPFEANWFKAKACLTMDQWPASCEVKPSHDVSIKLMQALVVMRKAKWGAFVNDVVKPQFDERMRMFGQAEVPAPSGPGEQEPLPATSAKAAQRGGDQDLQSDIDLQDLRNGDKDKGKNFQDVFDSVGAEAVTSDVDLSTGGSNSELGVQFVNSRFRTAFAPGRMIPYDPGTVFDINVYASDWIHGEASFSDNAEGVRTITPAAEVSGMTAPDQEQRTQTMEVWSLVKIRRNMADAEWGEYVKMTLDGLPDATARSGMEQKLDEANTKFKAFEKNVNDRQAAMLAKLTAQEKAFFGAGGGSAFAGDHGDHFQEDASFTRAANAIYEENLQEVKELRLRIEKLRVDPVANAEAISGLGVELSNKIAEALTYANEVYATEGAVQHTVLKQGAGKKLDKLRNEKGETHLTKVDYDLKPELYLQSVNENVGDSLHSIEHYKDAPRYAVYRAGKYMARLCDATDLLLGPLKGEVPGFKEVLTIGTESVRVKKIVRGDVEGDPKFVDDDAFFKKYKQADLPAVRATIAAYSAAIPRLLAEKKQRAEQLAKQAPQDVAS